MAQQLHFHFPTPGSTRTSRGYKVSWSNCAIMGVLNVTPDSFSDGGKFIHTETAIKRAHKMMSAGAFVIDIGGESSRPGAQAVDATIELDRILPVIKLLSKATTALISVDTSKPEVAAEALKAGAHIVNDIRGLRNPEMRQVCADAGAAAIVMHMQGEPHNMQRNPQYKDVVAEVRHFLANQAELALNEGIPSLIIDPGFGFGKALAHNISLMQNLSLFIELGYPVLLGASRKSSIHAIADVQDAKKRDPGSVAFHLYAAQQGAAMIRVHNVSVHHQALKVWDVLHDK